MLYRVLNYQHALPDDAKNRNLKNVCYYQQNQNELNNWYIWDSNLIHRPEDKEVNNLRINYKYVKPATK